ncbi:hypothetical protein BABINDRAFT_160948 [Babjeviella inositovora NRRL Y-12698]|uniref:Uncharacterized protein n=1 Tax=Babjeviella inositovora NRRL Y-12698 TaxID=984486 RepID=A0A1E3QSP3_9ASCO|nr:uncharacterized protein BABINDRAFT_160948 [Babjeviella inositovora NRRL Y-12698]ODQ80725.1 hypothetical protein BABINDRAFT_160948 [Babjeviella inositovora NRRL Y-12698]
MPSPKTTIIISNLPRAFFLLEHGRLLGAEKLKIAVLGHEDSKYCAAMDHWLALSFLTRIVIIFHSEQPAQEVLAFLVANRVRLLGPGDDFKIVLQENMLRRSKSDLHTQPQQPGEYQEPLPAKFDESAVIRKLRSESPLQVATPQNAELEELEYLVNANYPGAENVKLTAGDDEFVPRARSATQTLFTPPQGLRLDTGAATATVGYRERSPSSPIITLDDHF